MAVKQAEIKLLPSDIDAEESVNGSILIDPDAIRKVIPLLNSGQFWSEANEAIFQAALELYHRKEGLNQITIASELDRVGKLDSMGGTAYLSHLISICPTSLDIEHYGKIVYRKAVQRELIKKASELETLGYEGKSDTNELISEAMSRMESFRHINGEVIGKDIVTPRQSSEEVLEIVEGYKNPASRISWGLRGLDELTTGLYRSEVIIIAGTTGTGKSQLMLDAAINAANQGKVVLWASVEMGSRGLNERRLARKLGMDIRELRTNGVPDDREADVMALIAEIDEQPIYFLKSGISSDTIRYEAERLQEEKGLDIVFIDYIQKLRDCYGDRENQNVRVSRASNKIKALSVDLDVPVVAASQLHRIEGRGDPHPILSDLRDSGSLEQDADGVLMLYRDRDNSDEIIKQRLDVAWAKGRQVELDHPIEMRWKKEIHGYDPDYFMPFSTDKGQRIYQTYKPTQGNMEGSNDT